MQYTCQSHTPVSHTHHTPVNQTHLPVTHTRQLTHLSLSVTLICQFCYKFYLKQIDLRTVEKCLVDFEFCKVV